MYLACNAVKCYTDAQRFSRGALRITLFEQLQMLIFP